MGVRPVCTEHRLRQYKTEFDALNAAKSSGVAPSNAGATYCAATDSYHWVQNPALGWRHMSPTHRRRLGRIEHRDHPDGYPGCYLCGRDLIPVAKLPSIRPRRAEDWPTIEHIVPRARGGSNADENLKLSCPECNTRKGDRLLSELLDPEWEDYDPDWPIRSSIICRTIDDMEAESVAREQALLLDLSTVTSTAVIPLDRVPVNDTELLTTMIDETTNQLRLDLSASVLSERVDERQREITWTTYHCPWWMPKWLWRRVPTSTGRAVVKFEVRRDYPDPPFALGPHRHRTAIELHGDSDDRA